MLFCLIAYTALFQLAYKVTETAEEFKKVIELKSMELPFPLAKRNFKQILKSVPVLVIDVGGFHAVEKESVPIFLDYIVQQIVDLLLTF